MPGLIERMRQRYAQPESEAARIVEREVIGGNVGANGYTTLAQAERLLEQLSLSRRALLLDVGAGRGWPGLHLAARSGCRVVLTDVPEPALRLAMKSARRRRLYGRSSYVLADGAHLPFRDGLFHATVHTDTL